MKFVDEFRDPKLAHNIISELNKISDEIPKSKFMEICGGHTHTIYKHGIEQLLPENIEMVHGPGCPVCVLPMGRLDDAIWLAKEKNVTLCCFGDMMRVPGSTGSLLDARAGGAEIKMVYSPLDALRYAIANPEKQVVFFAIGFETTAPSTAATLIRAKQAKVENFSVYCNHVVVGPPIRAILESRDVELAGFVSPGHVSTVVGQKPYDFIVQDYNRPVVTAGFEPLDLLQAILMLARQVASGRAEVENQYTRVVTDEGNPAAISMINQTMTLRDTFEWRGLGNIDKSGYRVSDDYSLYDAELRFEMPNTNSPDPKACQCGEVLRGIIKPFECKVFGTACTPERPIGTCMVSPEGACAAYYTFGLHSEELIDLKKRQVQYEMETK